MDGLPPEILCGIFVKTLPCVHDDDCIPYAESIAAPLRVSHVCRRWRELALSFRELWSHLCIKQGHFYHRKEQKMMVEIFDTWLARTNDGPINFMIDCRLPSEATIQDHECAEYIFTTLIENQHRWKDVHIISYDAKFSPRRPGFNLTNMPLLTSLNLNVDCSLRSVVNLTPSSRLRRLEIRRHNFDLVVGSRLLHLEQARLRFSSHRQIESRQSILSCLGLLRNAPSLRCVHITTDFVAPRLPLPVDGERIMHTRLREIFLLEHDVSHLPATIVDTMTLPSLEKFDCLGVVGGEKLFRFFQRSTPPLTRIILTCKDTHEGDLIGILRLLPQLRNALLFDAELSGLFFRELTAPGEAKDYTSVTEQIVCPELSTLEIRGRFSETNEWLEPLRTMAKSRAHIPGTFRTIKFRGGGDAVTTTVADIDNFAVDIDSTRGVNDWMSLE